jgi:hypothetical protein
VDSKEAIRVIVKATRWLTTNPKTHWGEEINGEYSIYLTAKTPDYKANVRGVRFGLVYRRRNGRFTSRSPLTLEDHAQLVSRRDSVPLTERGKKEDQLGRGDSLYVDVNALKRLAEDDLVRMAQNAQRVMEAVG